MPVFFSSDKLDALLRIVEHRAEFESIISVFIIEQSISAAARMLISSLKYTRLLECLYVSATKDECPYTLCLAPVLHNVILRSSQRLKVQSEHLNEHLENFAHAIHLLQQYGEQNLSLADKADQKVDSGIAAAQLRYLAIAELKLSDQAKRVLNLASTKASLADYEQLVAALGEDVPGHATWTEPTSSRVTENSTSYQSISLLTGKRQKGQAPQVLQVPGSLTTSGSDEFTPLPSAGADENDNEEYEENLVTKRRRRTPLSDVSPPNSQQSQNQDKEEPYSTMVHPPSSANSVLSLSSPEIL